MNWNLYKTSGYNHLIPLDSGNYLLFNSLRLSLLEIEASKAKIISQWKDGIEFSKQELIDEDSFKILRDNFFIIEKNFDEFSIVKNGQEQYKKMLFDKGEFHLLVNTTNNCNMRCAYCFEGNKKTNKLSNKTIESIISKIKYEIENPQAPFKSLTMIWFGGEPLLNQKAIAQLSQKLISICKTHNIGYRGQLITNGTLLSSEFCHKMNDYKIDLLQISIDGDELTHNRRRPLQNKKNSYEEILNKFNYIPNNAHIHIRIHADKEVVKRIPYLLDDLEKRKIWPQNARRVKLHLGQKVSTDNDLYRDINLSNEEYYLAEYQFRLLCLYRYNNWAVRNNKPIANLQVDFPQLTFNICNSASRPYSMSIDDMGFIHRCWETVNFEETRIQHINDFDFSYNEYDQWKSYVKTDCEECKSCKVLPICDYRCTYRFMNNYKINCTKWKYMLPFYITNYYCSLKKENV